MSSKLSQKKHCLSLIVLLLLIFSTSTLYAQDWSNFAGGAKAVCSDADIDNDDDGLIEVCFLEGLNAMRYQLNGSGLQTIEGTTKITTGCASGGCEGYELVRDLDFDDVDSYRTTTNQHAWATTATGGWIPVGKNYSNAFTGQFDGNGYTISHLRIDTTATQHVGLFGYVRGTVRHVGLLDVDIHCESSSCHAGSLVGYNNGSITNNYASGAIRCERDNFCVVGGLVGRSDSSITNSYASGAVSCANTNSHCFAGGLVGYLVGYNNGPITNSYASGIVRCESDNFCVAGGLAGYNAYGSIANSYASGAVSCERPGCYAGGLVGYNISLITNSYASGAVSCASRPCRVGSLVGRDYGATNNSSAKTPAQLQGPTAASGIYSAWSTKDWDFGTNRQYPALKYKKDCGGAGQPVCDTLLSEIFYAIKDWSKFPSGAKAVCDDSDIDNDKDGLIEICYLGDLNAMRYQLDGSGLQTTQGATKITTGCTRGNCQGYELVRDLDFDDADSYRTTTNQQAWTKTVTGGWVPVGKNSSNAFTGQFDGNGYAISHLRINTRSIRFIGLFGYVQGTIRHLGLLGVDIRCEGRTCYAGGLVGYSRGSGLVSNIYANGTVIANCAGSFCSESRVGGLVGFNGGSITNSYTIGDIHCTNSRYCYAGGLAGLNHKKIRNSYANSKIRCKGGFCYAGGLTGYHAWDQIANSYASGTVHCESLLCYIGGLVGRKESASIFNSYWDTETSRIRSSTGGVGKTTAQLQSPTKATGIYRAWSTKNWDFGTNQQYPTLKYTKDCGGARQPVCDTLLGARRVPPIITIVGSQVVLEASTATLVAQANSITKREEIQYAWTQTSGPNVRFGTTDTKAFKFYTSTTFTGTREFTTLTFQVTATNAYGQTNAHITVRVQRTDNGPAPSRGINVNTQGEITLTIAGLDLSADPDGAGNKDSINYQWQKRGGADTTRWEDISGADSNKYTVPSVMSNQGLFRVQVDYKDAQGYRQKLFSNSLFVGTDWNNFPDGVQAVCDNSDIDDDNDGLIELCYLEDLDAIRYMPDGSAYKPDAEAAPSSEGCLNDDCQGYELVRDLDFNDDASYRQIANQARWTTGTGWTPIAILRTDFEGNGHTLSNLFINSTGSQAGLFGEIGLKPPNQALQPDERYIDIRNIGLIHVVIKTSGRHPFVGSLVAGNNSSRHVGAWIVNSYALGEISVVSSSEQRRNVGGLVGDNGSRGEIFNSYATVTIRDAHASKGYIGGLAGIGFAIENSYAVPTMTVPTESDVSVGGLVGFVGFRGKVSNSYARNHFTPKACKDSNKLGGFVGDISARGAVENSYWNTDSYGSDERARCQKGIGVAKESNKAHFIKGFLLSDLQRPIAASTTDTEPYFGWSSEHWDFGTSRRSPILKYATYSGITTACRQSATVSQQPLCRHLLDNQRIINTTVDEGGELVIDAHDFISASDDDSIRYQWQWNHSTATGRLRHITPAKNQVGKNSTSKIVPYTLYVVGEATTEVLITVVKQNNGDAEFNLVRQGRALVVKVEEEDPDDSTASTSSSFEYQWEYRTSQNDDWEKIPGESGTRYTLPPNTALGTRFRVQVQYKDGQNYETTVVPGIFTHQAPVIRITHPGKETNEGDKIKLHADVTEDIKVNYRWTQIGTPKVPLTSVTTSVLAFAVPKTFTGSADVKSLVIELAVEDTYLNTASTTQVTITVNKTDNGQIKIMAPPRHSTRTLTIPALDLSLDPDGDGSLVSCQWEKQEPSSVVWQKIGQTDCSYTIPPGKDDMQMQAMDGRLLGMEGRFRVAATYKDGQGNIASVNSKPIFLASDWHQFPGGATEVCGNSDLDDDDDGLIELCYLEDLDTMRRVLDGLGYQSSTNTQGCLNKNCSGYELVRDLDFASDTSYRNLKNKNTWTTGSGWIPIVGFNTEFEGNGHTLSNLFIHSTQKNVGLFATLKAQARIHNLGVVSARVQVSNNPVSVGLLAGQSAGQITNSYTTGHIKVLSVPSNLGGLVGENNGTIFNSYARAIVTYDNNGSGKRITRYGGLVGYSDKQISNSYADTDISEFEVKPRRCKCSAGGLVGEINENSEITDSFAIGRLHSSHDPGGLVGEIDNQNEQIMIKNSYWDVTATGAKEFGFTAGSAMPAELNVLGFNTTNLQVPFLANTTNTAAPYYQWRKSDWDFGTMKQYPAIKYATTSAHASPTCRTPETFSQQPICGLLLRGQRLQQTVVIEGATLRLEVAKIPGVRNGVSYSWALGDAINHPPYSYSPAANTVARTANFKVVKFILSASGEEDIFVPVTIVKADNGNIKTLGELREQNNRELVLKSTFNPMPDPDGSDSAQEFYQWQNKINGIWQDIATATQNRYQVPSGSEDKQFRLQIRYTDSQGYRTAVFSEPITPSSSP